MQSGIAYKYVVLKLVRCEFFDRSRSPAELVQASTSARLTSTRPSMISDFSFESAISARSSSDQVDPAEGRRAFGLQLPLVLPGKLLDLQGLAPNIAACVAHFEPLHLDWAYECESPGPGLRAIAVLDLDRETGGVWALTVLESAGTGRHAHCPGGTYGECVITLAGELDDHLDNGKPLVLKTGAVMFHAPETTHEPRARTFWVGLVHQPRGSTPVC